MAKINPYLMFDGNCEEAFKFYEKVFQGTGLNIRRFRGSPMEKHAQEGSLDKVMHAHLNIDGEAIMGSDGTMDRYQKPQGFHLSIAAPTPADSERIFNALSEGGKVEMPLQKTFWAAAFGMLTDRFGIPWMVNCEQQP